VRLEILGPSEAQAFEEIEYLVKYKNNGSAVLEDAQLTFQYPENSIPVNGENSDKKRIIMALEDIYPGEERSVSFKARLIGKENDTLKAEAQLRYRPKNLKAFFESSTTLTSEISLLPLNFEIDVPSKVEAGKDLQFFLNYFSNSDWPLSDLRVKIEYPNGFEFLSSKPQALEKTEWDLPLLNKVEGGRIEIKGKLFGQIRENKIFKATIGFWQQGRFILLKEVTKGTEILKPSLVVFQQINGSADYVASLGDVLHYEIFFRNIGEEPFRDMFLVSKLEGSVFDFDTLRVVDGQFNKEENFIIWDWREIPKLKFLEAGEEGKVEFWISLKKNLDPQDRGKDLILKNQITLSQVRENFETKIRSQLAVSQKVFFDDEVFGNSGPTPPKVGQTTTYTVVWQAQSYYSDLSNVKVKAVLPQNVRLTGRIFPEGAPLTFDSASREVVWSLGELSSRNEAEKSSPLLAFQIAFTPDSSQIGQTPQIIGRAVISGQDNFTGKSLQSEAPDLTTALPDDSSFGGSVK
jgi:hypothetical protein